MSKTIKLINQEQYNVFVEPKALTKMKLYCDICDKEVGWLGMVEKYDTGFLITDVMLVKQQVHATTTELDPQGILDLWNATDEDKRDKIKLWGHSHVNMSPSPSGQDDSQMDYFKTGNDWFIRLITNKKGDINITIYDFKNGIEVHDDNLYLYDKDIIKMREEITAEIKEKVAEKKIEITPLFNSIKDESDNTPSHYYGYEYDNFWVSVYDMFQEARVKYMDSFEDTFKQTDYYIDEPNKK